MSTYENWKRNPDTTRPLLKPFQSESWAIGLRKGNDALRNQTNEFLKQYKAQGGFEKLGDKYLGEQKTAFKQLGVPFVF
jgi:polar amino acid transport system substrate-binding protein